MTATPINQNTNVIYSNFIKEPAKKSEQQKQEPKAEAQKADSFESTATTNPQATSAPVVIKQKNKSAMSEGIKNFAKSLGICVLAGLIIGNIGNISKLFGRRGGSNGSTPDSMLGVANMWEDLTKAPRIEDMALPEGLKKTFQEIRKFIENPQAVIDGGGECTKAYLLYGPPGTGKTTFAKAIAKYFPNSRFANLDLTSLSSIYSSGTEKNLQASVIEICRQAEAHPDQKFFVFIDEIDTVMMKDNSLNAMHSNKVMNEFKRCLTERLGKHKNIITIGATNISINPDTGKFVGTTKELDDTMLSRFVPIFVGRPTMQQLRDAIIKHYADKSRVIEELATKDSEKLNALCEILAKEKHETSFRTLNSIFNTAATQGDMTQKVGFQEIFNAILAKKEEMHFSTRELEDLAERLGVTFRSSDI